MARTVIPEQATEQNFRVENNRSKKKLNSSHKTRNPRGGRNSQNHMMETKVNQWKYLNITKLTLL